MEDKNLPYKRRKKDLDNQSLSDKIGILKDVKIFVEDFKIQGAEVDDTARIQRAVDFAPEFSTLVFKNRMYTIAAVKSTKMLNIELNGAKFTLNSFTRTDSNGNQTLGDPGFWFTGSQGSSYALTTCTDKSTTITLSNSADASNFAIGDHVMVADTRNVPAWDNGVNSSSNTGYLGRSEINIVISVSSGVITLLKPIEWAYDTIPVVRKLNMIKKPTIDGGGAYITQVNPNAVQPSGSPLAGGVPHLFHFQYCISPKVSNCFFDKWQLHAVNFGYCIEPLVEDCAATDPYVPNNGGHGYFMRFDHCMGGLARHNYTRNVRHTVDFTQSYDGRSENNLAVNSLTAYLLHGLGSKRCSSTNDKAYGGDGWGMGNASFNADYDFTITNPMYLGSGTAINCTTNSVGLRVISPEIHSSGKGIVVTAGADRVSVLGGSVEITSDTSNNQAVLVRSKISLSDSFGIDVKDVSIYDVDFSGSSSLVLELAGSLSVMYNRLNINSVTFNAIAVNNTVTPTDVEIVGNRIKGTFPRGVVTNIAPTRRYVVSNNFTVGHTIVPFNITTSNNLRFFENEAVGVSSFTWNGDINAAKAGGALLDGNIPNIDDRRMQYYTANSNGTAGQWALLGTVTITQQYYEATEYINVMGGSSGGGSNTQRGLVYFRVKQQSAMGAAPSIEISLMNNANFNATDIVAVLTSNTGSQTVVQLYAKINSTYEVLWFKPLHDPSPSINGLVGVSWSNNASLVSSLPAGTQTTASYQPVMMNNTTANRPTSGLYVGMPFFDTTLNKPIYRNASNNGWVDATGAAV